MCRLLSLLVLLSFLSPAVGEETTISLSQFEASGNEITTSSTAEGGLLNVISADSSGNPGVAVLPESGESWDFSNHSRIEAVVSNPGDVAIPITLRVDNPGHWKTEPWNAESIRLAPGDTKTLVVFFGYSYGMQTGYALDPADVRQLLFFTEGAERERSFVVESIVATGSAGETPEEWEAQATTVTESGFLLGPAHPLESTRQLRATGGAKVTGTGDGFIIEFTEPDQQVRFEPVGKSWDLRESNHVSLQLENLEIGIVRPSVLVESSRGKTDPVLVSLATAEAETALIPFAQIAPWNVEREEGSEFDSRAVRSITFLPDPERSSQIFRVGKIQAVAPPAELPGFVGKQPPVAGEWIETFSEDFDGDSIDADQWNIYTENHWDDAAHFSAENVIVKDGNAHLRFERKTGHHNDDPQEVETDYATGFLDTYDKWTQKYGYFEARMKLPTAPGLWPAFWMMPDRGPPHIARWKREKTTDGGMEFDIFEYMTDYGPYRYHVAFHWDGYGKQHQKTGSSGTYMQTDAEGYVTAGLLWLSGEATYFCNGRPVASWEDERISSVPSCLMFTHVSGGWEGGPVVDEMLPDDFVIDYVRCWQRADLVISD